MMSDLALSVTAIQTPSCIKILLVEDSPSDAAIFIDTVGRSLAGFEFEVVHASTLDLGVRMIQQGGISIAFLDFHLPDGEGLEALTRLYQAAPEVPILILTGQEDDDLGMQAVQRGAQDYLIKGMVLPAVLSRVIRYSIHRKKVEASLLTAREEAIRSENFQTTFLASMSHEIRTPLTALLGFIQLASDKTASQEERDHYLQIAAGSGELLLGLVNDILEISAVRAGTERFHLTTFNLHELVHGVVTMVTPRAQQKGIALQLSIAPDVPGSFYCDQRRLQQVLLNLLSNAIKFTLKGEVSLGVEQATAEDPRQCSVRFVVRDTGIGIRPENIGKLFHLFEQTNKSIRTQFGGNGLGLFISRHFVRKLGGDIIVRSEVDRGSEFDFTLSAPLAQMVTTGVTPAAVPVHGAQATPLKVLLAEDVPELALLTQRFLRREPYTIRTVEDGRQAVNAFKEEPFDLVLMDMQMPVMDGYEAVREIRQLETLASQPKVPIIALTGNVMRDEIARCFEVGCNAHMAKPFAKSQLLDTIRQMTDGQPRPQQGD